MKPEMLEGPQAFENFKSGMKKLFQVPKAEVERAEKKYKAARKRKKAISSASRVPGAS
jgi:hypothetical protein